MTLTITIPTFETDRMIIRAPQFSDAAHFVAFKTSERAKFTGGPTDRDSASTQFGHLCGHWVLRGYGLFMAVLKRDPDRTIGGFGIFHPLKHEEPEFGWSLYYGDVEGHGYVTEAMRAIIPWAWSVLGVDTAQSHIDDGNDASVAVAKRLGATFDAETTRIANAPGGEFHGGDGPQVNIWRHHKGALT